MNLLDNLFITPNDCWEFTRSRNSDGYGNMFYEGKQDKAHRVSYIIHKGPIPIGMLVLHTCDNPPCCNPAHLYLGTNADNARDKVLRGRMANTDGANNPSAWVTEKEVRDIHAHLHYTDMTQQEIADKFGLTKGHVNNIKAGRAWNSIYKEVYDVAYID